MKTINVTFEDAEYKRLLKAKGEQNWHDFILKLVIE
jgi:predicted CopG family antitoxin